MLINELRQAVQEVRKSPAKDLAAMKTRKLLQLEKYDGVKTDWADFEQQLDIFSRCNQWTEEKGLCLAANLTESARTVLKGFSGVECQDFQLVFGRLKAKFDNNNQVDFLRNSETTSDRPG